MNATEDPGMSDDAKEKRDQYIDGVVELIDKLLDDIPKRRAGLVRIKAELEDEEGTDDDRATTLSQQQLLGLLQAQARLDEGIGTFEGWLCGKQTKTKADVAETKVLAGRPNLELLELQLQEAIDDEDYESAGDIRKQLEDLRDEMEDEK